MIQRDELLVPGDAAEIARRAAELLDSPARREEAAAWGRARVAAEYNWAEVCKAYEAVITRAADR